MRTKTSRFWALCVTHSIGLGCLACQETPPEAVNATTPNQVSAQNNVRAIRVEVAEMKSSQAVLRLHLPGEVQGGQDAMLAAALGGFVEKVYVDVGDVVKKGQILAAVNRSVFAAQLEQTRAQFQMADNDYRAVEVAGDSLAKTRRDAALFQKQAAEAVLRLAEINAERSFIRAPFSGVVALRKVEEGEVVPPGGVVVRLVALDPVKISLSISDRDISHLKPGLKVAVTTDALGQVYVGEVERLGPAADLDTRTFVAWVRVPNPDHHLKPGMIASVRTELQVSTETLSLPQHVLVTRLDGNGVFVEKDGKALWRSVELGGVVRDQVLIRSGLVVGDRVVVTGQRDLAEGDQVLVGRQGQCCADGQITFGEG